MEAPVNLFVNDNYVITLLATPEFKKELALGWLFDEGILQSFEDVKQVEKPDGLFMAQVFYLQNDVAGVFIFVKADYYQLYGSDHQFHSSGDRRNHAILRDRDMRCLFTGVPTSRYLLPIGSPPPGR